MRQILTNRLLLLFLLLVGVSGVQAQERLYDLTVNHRLSDYEKYMRSDRYASRVAGDTLDLPFFDDFSEPFSRLRNLGDDYPNPDRWIGNTVYINNHMAINPISQGVATFDGLDEMGRAYGFGFSLPSDADSLTSKPIRLSGTLPDSSVVLSFYYQAQGAGNAPEEEDLLIVQFKDTSETWQTVWEAEGYILEDFDFQRAMIPVDDEKYLFDGFQFRFRNFASLSGSVDHWHVDYVELDDGRSLADTVIRDVSQMCQTSYLLDLFMEQTSTFSLLKDYSAMPWSHYKTDPMAFIGDSAYTVLRNNDTAEVPTNFSLQILDHTGTQRYNVLSATAPVYPGKVCGNETNSCNVIGGSSNLLSNISSLVPQFPTDVEMTDDSTFFELRFSLGVDDQDSINDIRVEKQEFYNYYAYDDGTAEAAYGLGELENVGRVAVRYDVKKDDVLRAIQLYLNPVEFDLSQEEVQLAVWTGGEEPGDTIWTSPSMFFQYTDHVNYFYHYFLDREIQVNANSTIWVGWIQQPATNLKFSVGFDKRADHSDRNYYNLGTTWNQSSIPGSIMIRPAFGEAYDWVGVDEQANAMELSVYPNPSNGTVFIQERTAGQLKNANIKVFDLSGRCVHQQSGYRGPLHLETLNAGVYLLRVDTETVSFTNRLVLQ
ncbi:MAG: T9SS type A sorting domain-containing protein [Flavobacteriales bacterium]|nr:T9SS type A sorting domain-containing protein [Flavobacteriales bacterium]